MPRFHEGLSPKHRRFVEEYIIDHNATAAYQRAGFVGTRETARRNASRLLTNADIQAVLKQAEQEALARVHFRQHEVYSALRDVALSDISHYEIGNDGQVSLAPGVDKSVMRAISSIHRKTTHRTRGDGTETVCEVKITLWNKVEALRMAAQTQGMLKPEKPAVSDQQEAASHSFQTLIQIVQQHGITSKVGAEYFRSSPVEKNGHLPNRPNGHAD